MERELRSEYQANLELSRSSLGNSNIKNIVKYSINFNDYFNEKGWIKKRKIIKEKEIGQFEYFLKQLAIMSEKDFSAYVKISNTQSGEISQKYEIIIKKINEMISKIRSWKTNKNLTNEEFSFQLVTDYNIIQKNLDWIYIESEKKAA